MVVYDLAHRLARNIKESTEYQDFLVIRKELLDDGKASEMLQDFRKEEMKLQAKVFSGQEISEEEKTKLNNLREIINLNQKVKKYIEAEYRMGIVINDLQEIIFSDLELGLPQEEKKHPEE